MKPIAIYIFTECIIYIYIYIHIYIYIYTHCIDIYSPATAIIKWSWLGYSWGFSWAADGGYGDIQLSSHGVHVHKLNQLIWGAKEEYLFTILYIYAIYANICMHIQMHTQT